ncbi:MAG: hypothetical protein QXN59_02070 [Candidatus Micrarchaeaceae archaeon]
MILVEDFVKAIKVSFYDENSISEFGSVRSAFAFYYKAAIIPIGISAAMLILFGNYIAQYSGLGLGGLLGGSFASTSQFSDVYSFIFGIVSMLVLVPAMIIFETAFYHFVGHTLMHRFNKGISNTAGSAVYGFMPLVVLSWSFPLPLVGALAKFVGIMWGFVILIASLAKLHGISVESVILSMLIISFLAGIALIIIIVPIFLNLSSSISSLPVGSAIASAAYPSTLTPSEAAAYSWVPIPYSILQGAGSLTGGNLP